MLMDVFRVMINNSFKESFYREKKINILITFFISVKTFLKLIINYCSKGHDPYFKCNQGSRREPRKGIYQIVDALNIKGVHSCQ